MEISMPLISIIVPVYNVENYLPMCLESLLNQTYRNIEIILVDDGSKDTSGKICDEYALKDSRFVVLHKENCGVAQARNSGIEISRGEYIMFVDSDDWVDIDICSALMESLSKYQVETAMCSYVREYPDKSLVKVICAEDTVWDGQAFQRRLCGLVDDELRCPENLDSFSIMCGKLYPAHAVKNIKVVDLSVVGSSEDLLYNLEVFSNVENIVYINKPLYHYRKCREGSNTFTFKPCLEKQWDVLFEKMRVIIEKNQLSTDCIFALDNRIALSVIGLGLNCVQDGAGFSEKYKRAKIVVNNTKKQEALRQLSLRYMPFHWKIFFFSAKHRMILLFYFLLIMITKLKGKI